jgi:hypothetical protein
MENYLQQNIDTIKIAHLKLDLHNQQRLWSVVFWHTFGVITLSHLQNYLGQCWV